MAEDTVDNSGGNSNHVRPQWETLGTLNEDDDE